MRRRRGISTEDRIRAARLIEDLTKSPFAGWYHSIAITGGGASQGLKEMLRWEYELEKSKEKAKRAAIIKPIWKFLQILRIAIYRF